MMGRKIVRIAALEIIAVVAFYMARWFGYKAVVGILLCVAAFALRVGMANQERDEKLFDETVEMICDAVQEVIEENGIDLKEEVKKKIEEEK